MSAPKLSRLGVAFLLFWPFIGAWAQTSAPLLATNLPPHPRLLLNAQGVAALKARIAGASWAKSSWARLEQAAQKSLAQPVNLPPRGGNWSHHYVCPTHGARLSQSKSIGPWQWEHLCPVDRHILRGDPATAATDFDGNAISAIHSDYAQQVLDLGLAYQVTGDPPYARKARDILLAYADRYAGYALHDNQGRPGAGGRIASQSLTEASWLIPIAQGMDLIWTTLSESERQIIADQLLRPALQQVILPRRLGIHNIQCRHNSAIGLVGFLLGDQKLISLAIDDPVTGFRSQLDKGVMADGMWLEGSSGYHFFTIAGLWPLAEAARHCAINLYTDKFRSMFEGPLALAMPNLVLPNFNDSGTVPLLNQADYYELALARFGQPAFAPLISSSDRDGRLALLFGTTNLPATTPTPAHHSRNLPSSGYAILQQGQQQDATWLCVKYGPHGGGHGHPDKNTFILYTRGQIIGTDAGTHAYGSPLHRDWDKTTLAHNTLVMDEHSQAPATGKTLAFGTEQAVDYSITDAGPIYPGVTYTRTIALLDPQLILFIDQVQADQPHLFDLAYHQIGRWADLDTTREQHRFKPWPSPRLPGYVHLTQTASRTIAGENLVLHTHAGNNLRPALTIAATGPTEIITGYGILKTTQDLTPILLQRRNTRQTAWIWAIALDGNAPQLRVQAVTDTAGNLLPLSAAALVQVTTPKHQLTILVNPRARAVTARFNDGPPTNTEKPFSVY